MRLVSPRTELAVLRAGTHRNPSISGTVLSGLDESYFYSDTSVETFSRIQKTLKQTGELPSWRDLCEDPKLSEEVRARLRKYGKSDAEPIRNRKEALRAVRRLNEYRQLRGMFTMSEDIVKKLRKNKVHIEEVMDQFGEDLVSLRQRRSDDAVIVHFGVGNNADGIVARLLDKNKAEFLPTLFDEFDSKNGGISPGNLFTIGGSSGGGKSALAAQLAINWSSLGESVCMVPLEMTEDEMTARLMANAAELDVRKILFRKLSEGEERKYKKAYRRFVLKRKEQGGRLTFFKPKQDMTIEEILACTYTLNPSVIMIDYISLLKGVDGDDQWQKLGAVARYCKVYAETHNVIIVLLCQVSEEGKIRYAQAIKEHCLAAGSWIDTPDGLKTVEAFVADPSKRGAQPINEKVMSGDVAVPTSAFHNNGRKEVFELTTQTGFSVEATAGHKFLSFETRTLELRWKRLGDLKEGDYVASSRSRESIWPKASKKQYLVPPITTGLHHNAKHTCTFPKAINKELGYFIGGMLSDGHTGGVSMVTTATQREFAEEMQTSFEKNFGKGESKTWDRTTKGGHTVVRVQAKNWTLVHSFMTINFDGWNGTSKTKFIPAAIMEAPKQTAAACLRGIFDGDGTLSGNSLVLDSFSPEMLRRTKVLLLKFGIDSIVRGTRLTINGVDSQKTFASEIGFTVHMKMAKLLELIAAKESTRSEQPRRIELTSTFIRAHNQAVTIVDKNLVKKNMVAATQFDWVSVKSIVPKGKKVVYDITVPDVHNYVTNGLVTHNSNYCWTFVSTKESRDAGIMNVSQIKARNGELFDFNLKTQMDVMRIRSMTSEERDAQSSASLTTKKKSKKDIADGGSSSTGKSPKYLKDISDDE